MTDTYKAFVRNFRAACAVKKLDVSKVAEIMNVHRSTIYKWWGFKSVMDGEAVFRCIKYIMDGVVKC